MKSQKAITLISLVITIVVLIILASVAIYLSLGDNGIFNRSKQAKEVTNKQEATDIINLKITTAQMNKYAEKQEMPTLKELSEVLRDDNEIAYVTEKSQVASTKYEVGDNPSSIFTKLNKYPYEFEISSKLQLASINGVKIADSNTNTAETTLWEGKSKDGSELELNDNLSKYNFIEVYFTVNGRTVTEIMKFDVKKIIEVGELCIYSICGWNYYGTYSYDVENNKFINTNNGVFNHDTHIKKFYLEIYKIVGY